MSAFTPKNYAAIGWYADAHSAIPQLSAWPTVYFKVKETGNEISGNISTLTALHETWLKEVRKEASRAKRMAAKGKSTRV